MRVSLYSAIASRGSSATDKGDANPKIIREVNLAR